MFIYDCRTKKWAEVPNEDVLEPTQEENIENMQPPTTEERLEALEMALLELAEVMCNG